MILVYGDCSANKQHFKTTKTLCGTAGTSVRAHAERSMFVASLPVSASTFEIVSVTQSSVKTAPQAKKIDAVCGFLKDFYVMENVTSLSQDFFSKTCPFPL